MKTLVFTAKSDYARFRCPHTTTSALSFLTAHPIAVRGLIGAVLGIEYDKLYDFTKDLKVGIQVLNPIYRDTQSFNLIAQTNNNKAANFQSRIQFLRDVQYRIFVHGPEEKIVLLKDTLENHRYVFTPYLGCSEHIAKLEWEGMWEGTHTGALYVDTIVPKEYVDFSGLGDTEIFTDRIPIENNKEREYTQYSNIVISIRNPLRVKNCEIFQVGEYHVFFF